MRHLYVPYIMRSIKQYRVGAEAKRTSSGFPPPLRIDSSPPCRSASCTVRAVAAWFLQHLSFRTGVARFGCVKNIGCNWLEDRKLRIERNILSSTTVAPIAARTSSNMILRCSLKIYSTPFATRAYPNIFWMCIIRLAQCPMIAMIGWTEQQSRCMLPWW